MIDRLLNELALLSACEKEHKIPAAPIARQLIADAECPLPDVLPPRPVWLTFEWPRFGDVDFRAYWRQVDARQG